MKIASPVAHFDHLVYIVSVNQEYSNKFIQVALFVLQNLNQHQQKPD